MSLATSLLCLSALLPAPQNDLKLPARSANDAATKVPLPVREIDGFRRDLDELASRPSRTEQKLRDMAKAYPAIEALILDVARGARAKEMGELMIVARRFGTARVAAELRFQLLARPLGNATRTVVDTMVFLMGPERDPKNALDEKKALRDCIRGRIARARRPATEALAKMVDESDTPFAIALTSDQSLDLQLRGVDLLRAIDSEAAHKRLIELLSKGPALAGATCETLILLGERAVPALLDLVSKPPIDRGFCYASFALVEIGGAVGKPLLPAACAVKLKPQLKSRETLTRSLAAIALADLAYYAAPGSKVSIDDVAVGDALLELVDSRVFVPNLGMLRRPAEQRLVRMTGRVVSGNEAMSWRDWWPLRRQGFVGIRASVAVDKKNVASAVVTMRAEGRRVRVLAAGLAGLPPMEDCVEIVLADERMLALVGDLEALGFGDAKAMRHDSALPITRSLELQVGDARTQVSMPASENMAFDGLVSRIDDEVAHELWQLYRDPQKEPDRAAFWRAEQRWRKAHTDDVERCRRFGRRMLTNWDVLAPWLRGRALEHLFARSDRKKLFDERDADRMLAILRATGELGDLEMRLLELAAGVPGDRTWRECVDVAASLPGGGREAVRSVFAVLGPDAVLAALSDERAIVRRVAIDEAVITKDLRAGPRLVEILQNDDEGEDLRRAAAYACGQLRLAAARKPLVSLIAADHTAPLLRRECLRALGRTGGEHAFSVLDRALHAPVAEDREAALKGLGELRDVRAAHTLAELAVIAHGKPLGELARFYLGRMGASLAVPALRQQVKTVQDPVIRTELVLLLGGYQDPRMVPELMGLLRTPERADEATAALMTTTGVDLVSSEDRWLAMDDWWRVNRSRPQWQWLLDALAAEGLPTLLRPESFTAAAGSKTIPELARLLDDLREPRLFVLTSAVLRDVTKEDYGVVTMQTPIEVRAGIAASYRLLFEAQKAAQGR